MKSIRPIQSAENRCAFNVASPDRLMRETGWRSTIDFEQGMKEFALAPIRGWSPRQ